MLVAVALELTLEVVKAAAQAVRAAVATVELHKVVLARLVQLIQAAVAVELKRQVAQEL